MVMIAYNEESNISKVIDEYYNEIFVNLPKGSEYILYLDAPTDGTSKVVKKITKNRSIKVVLGKVNLKYAGALRKALFLAKNEVIFYSDSSGKHKAKDFWNLIKEEENYDIVTGLRVFDKNYPLTRRFVSLCQRGLISILFFIKPHDFNTGYKIIHKKVLNEILDKSIVMRYTISSEMLIRAHKKGFTIKDIPVSFSDSHGARRGTKIWDIPKMSINSLKGYIKLFFELNF